MNTIDISIVLPVYNERKRILYGVEQAIQLGQLLQQNYEIIIADDGSDDDSIDTIASLQDNHPIKIYKFDHKGKGHAVKQAMLQAKGRRVLFSDIDWSVPILQAKQMLDMPHDIVIASREIHGARRIAEPPHRHILGTIFNRWVQWTLLSGYMDTQCGCKVFAQSCIQSIFSKVQEDGWAFDVEVLLIAHTQGYRVYEHPISWQYQSQSKIRIIKDGLQMAYAVLRMKSRLQQGQYR